MFSNKRRLILGLLTVLSISSLAQKKSNIADYIIINAYVFNGDGKDSVLTNVAITGDKISYIGKEIVKSKEVIDAKGKFLAPGFIDPHTHADRWIEDGKRQDMLAWLYQGVTTVFAGNDGFGPHKIDEKMKQFQQTGMGTNFGLFVGFGPVRKDVLGTQNQEPNKSQLEQMKKMVASGMKEGALGFSTGLIYLPQMYSKTAEIVELYKEAAKYNAVYDSHMRSEGNKVLESVDELLEIGANSNLPLHISHIKISGENNWGNSGKVIEKINNARAKGINVTANQYPFIASMTGLKSTLIPAWAQEGGNKSTLARFENPDERLRIIKSLKQKGEEVYKRVIVISPKTHMQKLTGKSVYDIAKEWGIEKEDAALEILKMDITASCINFSMNEEDVVNFMKQPWVMTGSDGGGLHPRTYSTFTRVIEEYVMKRKLFSLSWAIHRATGLTATTFNLKDRGFIKEGYYADLIVFDPKNVKANSTFVKADQYSEGMDYVFVNGVLAIDKGQKTGKLAGQIIKK